MTNKNESTTEVAVIDPTNIFLQSLNEAENTKEEFVMPPYLEINMKPEDKDGNAQPIGVWHLKNTNIFSKNITFRPLVKRYQYIKFIQDSEGSFKFDNKTIFMKSFFDDEPLDLKGGVRCGRPAKALGEEAEKWKKEVPANIYLFGIAYHEGNAYPAILKCKGMTFFNLTQAIEPLEKAGANLRDIVLNLSTAAPKKGIYYNAVIKAKEDKLKLTKLEADIGADFMKYINSENEYVIQKHQEARIQKSADTEMMKTVEAVVMSGRATVLDDFEDDDLPFGD